MKKILFPILMLFFIYGCCSLPTVSNYHELYSITKQEKKIKSGFGSKRRIILIEGFRKNEMYDEDITALKETVEKYIAQYPDLNEGTKNNLRELRVALGATKEEVKLLLGEPNKVTQTRDKFRVPSEIWIYRTNKRIVFTVVVVPVFVTHEGYYLYFKDSALATIERHSLRQTFESSGIALFERRKSE